MKIKIKNPIFGVAITIVDKIADDGFIHCTHTSEETVNKTFKVDGHEHDLNDEHESVSQLTVNRGGCLQANHYQIYRLITMSTMSGVSANYWTMINEKPKYSRIFIQKI